MIVFSNAKINLGLWILKKRTDGYHDISTVFYPIPWKDILEIIPIPHSFNEIDIHNYGIPLNIPKECNILYKTYHLLKNHFGQIPAVQVYLYKNVPYGAGLGAGSANAAFFLKSYTRKFHLYLSDKELKEIAAQLGSDCVFFTVNSPSIAFGRGEVLHPLSVNLSGYFLWIVYPNIVVSTKEMYAEVIPRNRTHSLKDIVQSDITRWKYELENDFEKTVFKKYPRIAEIKEQMYKEGAIYSSMSGSGSAVFGLFKEKPPIHMYPEYRCFCVKI